MYKRKLFLIGSLMVLVVLTLIATHVYPLTVQKQAVLPTKPAAQVQPTYSQDAQVVAVMQRLGLDYSRLNLVYGDNPGSTHDASFETPNTLYITSKVRPENMNVMVSHEYLHYIQYTHRAEEQTLYPSIQQVMDTNSYLQGRIAAYPACTGDCFTRQDEAEAYACTELPDTALRADFVAWCNKYLPQRSLLFSH